MGTNGAFERFFDPSQRWVLGIAVVLVGIALAWMSAFLPVVRTTPLRVAFTLPLALFLSGYTFMMALFPRSDLDTGTRLVLSVGCSLALLAVVTLSLGVASIPIHLGSVVVAISLVTLCLTSVVAARRGRPNTPNVARSVSFLYSSLRPKTGIDALFLILILVSLILIAGAATSPERDAGYTELSLLHRADDGTLVADDYRTVYTEDESADSLHISVENHENRRQSYTVIVTLDRVTKTDQGPVVGKSRILDTTAVTLEPDERRIVNPSIVPSMAGDRLRLTVLLYRGEPPDDPTPENAYQETHLWVTVQSSR